MAEITGTVTVKHGKDTLALRLTFGTMAQLQSEFGADIAGLLSGGETPNFSAMLRMVELAVQKGSPAFADQAEDIADSIATVELVKRLIVAAFPEAQVEGNGAKVKAKAA